MLGRCALRFVAGARPGTAHVVGSPQKAMSGEAATFSGDFAKLYAHAAEQHRHPNGPWKAITDQIAALGLSGGAKVLDVASGAGEPAATLALALPDVSFISSDVSDDMVQKAVAVAESIPNMSTATVDAHKITFPDAEFDAITCCYGVMFMEDPAQALAEVARVLKPGGTFVNTHWIEIPAMAGLRKVMTKALGRAPPPPQVNPMVFAEPGSFDALVQAVGLQLVSSSEPVYHFDLGTDPEYQFNLNVLPAAQTIDSLGIRDKVREAWDATIDEYSTVDEKGNRIVGGMKFGLTVWKKP